MAKHGKELSPGTRKNIIKLKQSGHRVTEISRMLKLNRSTVSKVVHRYDSPENCENKPRSGRPKILGARVQRQLQRLVKVNRRLHLGEISSQFNQVTPVKVSRRTVKRNLHKLGYKRCTVRKCMGIRETNRKKRLAWCMARKFKTVNNYWKRVIFSDEMMVIIKPGGEVKVWRKTAERWRPECLGYVSIGAQSTIKLMVWGCITYDGVGTLSMVNGNMNSEKYIDTLENKLWPVIAKNFGANPYYFQEDNAPCHKSRLCEQWK